MLKRAIPISTRRRRQRGSETIEAGLITTIMFALIFLLLDISLSLFIKVTLQEAVRDGVRFGVTEQLRTGDTYLADSIANVVKQNAGGFISNAGCQVTVSYFDPYGGVTTTPTTGTVLNVAVQGYQYTPLGAIFKSAAPVSINVQASDIMEPCPAAGCPAGVNPIPPTCP